MVKIVIELNNIEYKLLEQSAKKKGQPLKSFVHDCILQFLKLDKNYDVTKDPVYNMEGYDIDKP
ncbi:MAG: hypothetical protein D6813_11160, partial [Calditrichaeota bacterium]